MIFRDNILVSMMIPFFNLLQMLDKYHISIYDILGFENSSPYYPKFNFVQNLIL